MSKAEADNLRKVDAAWLRSQGYFEPNTFKNGTITWTWESTGVKNSIGIAISTYPDNMYIKFNYTRTYDDETKKDFEYRNRLTTTDCRYGGKRYWFICGLSVNGRYCGRRVRTLYQGGDYFGCRHCYNLTYRSRNENSTYRNNPMFRTINLMCKSDELREKIRIPYYNGKPTRKQRRLERVERRLVLTGLSPLEAETGIFNSLARPKK